MSSYQEDSNTVTVHFDSVHELSKYHNREHELNEKMFHERMFSKSTEYKGWLGPTCRAPMDIYNNAMDGDPELYNSYLRGMIDNLDRTTQDLENYTGMVLKKKRRKVRRGQGDELDIHKVYQGQLDTAWRTTEVYKADKQTSLVTLLVDINTLGQHSATDSLWRAAASLKVYQKLIQMGKTVRVVACASTANGLTNTRKRVITTVVIKNFQETMSLERLAAMTHAGFLRVFDFAMMHAQPYNVSAGYGRTLPLKDNLPVFAIEEMKLGKSKFIVIDQCLSLRDAQKTVRQIYSELDPKNSEAKL